MTFEWHPSDIRVAVQWLLGCSVIFKLSEIPVTFQWQLSDIPVTVQWQLSGTLLVKLVLSWVTFQWQICTPSAYLAIYLKGIGSMALQGHNKNLADAKNFPEIEASDWSRAQNPGFWLVERLSKNFQRGYPYDPGSLPMDHFWRSFILSVAVQWPSDTHVAQWHFVEKNYSIFLSGTALALHWHLIGSSQVLFPRPIASIEASGRGNRSWDEALLKKQGLLNPIILIDTALALHWHRISSLVVNWL